MKSFLPTDEDDFEIPAASVVVRSGSPLWLQVPARVELSPFYLFTLWRKKLLVEKKVVIISHYLIQCASYKGKKKKKVQNLLLSLFETFSSSCISVHLVPEDKVPPLFSATLTTLHSNLPPKSNICVTDVQILDTNKTKGLKSQQGMCSFDLLRIHPSVMHELNTRGRNFTTNC